MTPTISFHHVDRITLGPIDHFDRGGNAGEFWTRDLMLTAADGRVFTLGLFSEDSAEQLELGGGPKVISCTCGYVGADESHTPPDPEGKLAAASERFNSRLDSQLDDDDEQEDPDDAE